MRPGIDDRFCPDLVFVLDQLKRLGKLKEYIRVRNEDMVDEATYDADAGVLRIRESTYQPLDCMRHSSKEDYRRARYTVAHEIAHIALGHSGLHYRGVTSDAAKRVGSRMRPREREAERFAAAFLVPSHLARPDLSAEHVAELFHISTFAAKIRKQELERMDCRKKGVRRPLPKLTERYLRDARRKGHTTTSLDDDDDHKA
jgi:Zn-dependent peptidase ImmA (M78 family)